MMDCILLVEDNPMEGLVIEDVFDNAQIPATLFTAENVDDAMDLAVRRNPLMVLVDLDLADQGGWDMLCRMKKNAETKDIPVWSMSSRDVEDAPVSTAGICFDEYLYKPIDRRELVRQISRMIDVIQHSAGPPNGRRQMANASS